MGKSEKVLQLCRENDIRMIDFKMVDLDGRFRHITIPVERFGERIFEYGIGFDGSNYGYAPIEKSDMVFIPDPDSAVMDPCGNPYAFHDRGCLCDRGKGKQAV